MGLRHRGRRSGLEGSSVVLGRRRARCVSGPDPLCRRASPSRTRKPSNTGTEVGALSPFPAQLPHRFLHQSRPGQPGLGRRSGNFDPVDLDECRLQSQVFSMADSQVLSPAFSRRFRSPPSGAAVATPARGARRAGRSRHRTSSGATAYSPGNPRQAAAGRPEHFDLLRYGAPAARAQVRIRLQARSGSTRRRAGPAISSWATHTGSRGPGVTRMQ